MTNISQFSNLTSRAVSLSLEDKDEPFESLQLLELGRGIIANLQLEVCSDISELSAAHSELAQQTNKHYKVEQESITLLLIEKRFRTCMS